MSSGLVIGKFMPPHMGHKYLIDFARSFVDDLTVQVCSIQSEPISGHLRYRWMRDSFPTVQVVHNSDENPQEPQDCPDEFWDIWRESLLSHMDEPPDYLFASEAYGLRLAEELGAKYIPVDHSRELVPVSGWAIRHDPMHYWDFILPEARPYFLLKVAIIGPEGTGKTTLASNLAAYYHTRYVSEYARPYLDIMGFEFDLPTFLNIARGHRASEEAMARQSNRVLFIDTESIVTRLWAWILIGEIPDIVQEYVEEDRYDLYLVMPTVETWFADPQRLMPELEARKEFERECIEVLDELGRKYIVLNGDWEERERQAISAVDALLSSAWGAVGS